MVLHIELYAPAAAAPLVLLEPRLQLCPVLGLVLHELLVTFREVKCEYVTQFNVFHKLGDDVLRAQQCVCVCVFILASRSLVALWSGC